MTKFTNKSFSVVMGGSQAYRDNYDSIFKKKEPELRGFDIDASRYLNDGMPSERIERIRRAREDADRAWDRGWKDWSAGLHRDAERIRDEWYWTHKPELAVKYGYPKP